MILKVNYLSKCLVSIPKINVNVSLKDCSDDLEPRNTRTFKSCNLLNYNRFSPLCDNPQELVKIHDNSYIGKNTRLFIKDASKSDFKPQTSSQTVPFNQYNTIWENTSTKPHTTRLYT